MDASSDMNTDVFKGCSIRGLPIGTPFRTQIHLPRAKGTENENVNSVFIISTFRNGPESEVTEISPDSIWVSDLKALASTENSKNVQCRCHLQLETCDSSVQTDTGELEFSHQNPSVDAFYVKIEDGKDLQLSAENTKCLLGSYDNESKKNEKISSEEKVEKECANERPTRRRSSRIKSGFVSKYGLTESNEECQDGSSQYPDVKVLVEVDTDYKESEEMQIADASNDEENESDSSVDDLAQTTSSQPKKKRSKKRNYEKSFRYQVKATDSEFTDMPFDDLEDIEAKESIDDCESNRKVRSEYDSDPDFDPDSDCTRSNNADEERKKRKKSKNLNKKKRDGQNTNVEKKPANKQSKSNSELDLIIKLMNMSSDYEENEGKKKKKRRKNKTAEDPESGLDDDDFMLDSELVKLSEKEQKIKRRKQKEKLWKQTRKIKIKLDEHPDKFRVESMESFARKDRGKAPGESAVQVMVCTICEKFKAENVEVLEFHIESHLNGELHCTECDFIGTFPGDLKRHIREVHKPRIQICAECGDDTNGPEGLMNHMGLVHDKPQYKCQHCLDDRNVHYASLTHHSARIHLRKEHPDKLFHCDNCGKMYTSQRLLKKHEDSGCTGKEPKAYPCEKCGKTYSSINLIRDHISRVHSNIRRYQCPQCPYAASRRSGLNKHLLVHEGYHPHKCDQCTFSCVQKFQLTSHMRTHTGAKPYKCDQCQYAAAWKVQLKDHLKAHSMPSAILCQQCNILTKDQRAFKMHVSKEHSQSVN